MTSGLSARRKRPLWDNAQISTIKTPSHSTELMLINVAWLLLSQSEFIDVVCDRMTDSRYDEVPNEH